MCRPRCADGRMLDALLGLETLRLCTGGTKSRALYQIPSGFDLNMSCIVFQEHNEVPLRFSQVHQKWVRLFILPSQKQLTQHSPNTNFTEALTSGSVFEFGANVFPVSKWANLCCILLKTRKTWFSNRTDFLLILNILSILLNSIPLNLFYNMIFNHSIICFNSFL